MAVTTTIYRRPPPNEHLKFSEHLTAADCDQAIRETYIGQAHIAGTGPAGTTCRECRFWHKWEYVGVKDGVYVNDYVPCPPGFYSKRHSEHPNEVKKAYCNRPILNKAWRLIPHTAKSCRLFEPAADPVPAKRPS